MEDYERNYDNLNVATECQGCLYERALCIQFGECLLCLQEDLIKEEQYGKEQHPKRKICNLQ